MLWSGHNKMDTFFFATQHDAIGNVGGVQINAKQPMNFAKNCPKPYQRS